MHPKSQANLNKLQIEVAQAPSEDLEDCSAHSSRSGTRVYFRNLEARLLKHINESSMALGCVAWLTNEPVLKALSNVRAGCSIIVQKEDFLRPDIGGRSNWKTKLRNLYSAIKPLDRLSFNNWKQSNCELDGVDVGDLDFDGLDSPRSERSEDEVDWNDANLGSVVGSLSTCGDSTLQGVRCVGNHNSSKNPAFPRMHNKFLVFFNKELLPQGVWTGSFNLTFNATMSFENAVFLTDPIIVEAYFKEWGQLVALSEPLDWESEWCAPEWRIGS